MNKLYSFLFFFMCMSVQICFSQVAINTESPTVPTSPQAQSIARYGDYSVDNCYGIPDISVPLFEIDHHGYKIPMILRYIPQPIKPGYNYDVYGFCWALSINSCISRTIEYAPDEDQNFKLNTNHLDYKYKTDADNLLYLNWAHDKFNATLPDGTSFEFVIDNDGNNSLDYTISNGRNVKISCTYTSRNIDSFVVIDENGIKYTFSGADTPYEGTKYYSNRYVSWQLTRIDIPNISTPILFSYDKSIETRYYRGYSQEPMLKISHEHFGDSRYSSSNSPDNVYASNYTVYPSYFHKMLLLTSINYGTTNININYSNSSQTTNYNYVNKISVNDNNILVRKINLDYRKIDYNNTSTLSDTLSMLTRLSIEGANSSDNPLVYKFDYYSLSSLLGCYTDHWGNCNRYGSQYDVGKMNIFVEFDTNTYPIFNMAPISNETKSKDDINPYYKLKLMRSGSNTDPRQAAPPSLHNVMTKMTYPTGGYSIFEFENNQFLTRTAENGDYIYDKNKRRVIEGGGFRISRITNYNSNNNVASVKSFGYGRTYAEEYKLSGYEPFMAKYYPDKNTGLGEAVVDPTIFTYMDYSSYQLNINIRNMIAGLDEYGFYRSFSNPFTTTWMSGNNWYWECTFSPVNFRRLLNGRNAVVYSDITEYDGDINSNQFSPQNTTGKIVSHYDIDTKIRNDTSFFESPEYCGNTLYYISSKYNYNQLSTKTYYKYLSLSNTYEKTRDEKYSRTSDYNLVTDYQSNNNYPADHYPEQMTVSSLYWPKSYYIGCTNLNSCDITDYRPHCDAGPSIVQSEGFMYNGRNQVSCKTYKNIKEKSTSYSYPEINNNGTTSAAIKKMVGKNMINQIVEEKKGASFSGNSNLFDGTKIDYDIFPTSKDSVIMPSIIYKLKTGKDCKYVEKEHILRYSPNGNPIELVEKDGVDVIYLWSYDDRYLIAEIKNASYSTVENAVSSIFGMTIDDLAKQNNPNVTLLASLRNHSMLSGACVTTYTYRPLIGVTSITDVGGMTTYYDYDSLGRLIETYYYENNIVDASNKRTVSQNEYNYVNH